MPNETNYWIFIFRRIICRIPNTKYLPNMSKIPPKGPKSSKFNVVVFLGHPVDKNEEPSPEAKSLNQETDLDTRD